MGSKLTLFAALLATGCYPTLPPHLAEGTEVNEAKQVGLTIAGGGAGFDVNCCGQGSATQAMAGLEARVRVGVGARQEVGASLFGGAGTTIGNGEPPIVVGGKASYKVAPSRWVALIASAGGLSAGVSAVAIFGGDLAVVVAPYTAPSGLQVYTGAKGSFSVPILQNAKATNEAFTFPIGLVIPVSDRTRLIGETGFVLGLGQQSGGQTAMSPGGYGLFAYAHSFR
jgi:hypothetical protein